MSNDALVPAPIAQAIAKREAETPQSAKVTRLAAFTPVNLTEAIALSKLIANSDLAPKEYKGKPGNVLIGMQYAAEIGVPPLTGLQNISIINGRASLWGDLFLGVIQTHPQYEWHKEWMDGTGEQRGAICQMKRRGQEVHTVKFTVADAKTARLWGKDGPWKTTPDRMLQMRARGFAGRDKFSDALKGLIIAEEAMDLAIDTTPAKQARDTASLDVGTITQNLVASSEPNRGHGNEGLRRDEQSQPEPKRDPIMCGKCGKIDSHEDDCPDKVAAEQDRKTSKPTTKGLYLILSVEERTSKKKQPYLVLNVAIGTPEGDKEGKLYVWNKALHGYLVQLSDKKLVAEVSEQPQGDKTFFQVEHILELDGVAFVNDMPAQQGSLAMPAEQEEDF
jgi:hypothetical protein